MRQHYHVCYCRQCRTIGSFTVPALALLVNIGYAYHTLILCSVSVCVCARARFTHGLKLSDTKLMYVRLYCYVYWDNQEGPSFVRLLDAHTFGLYMVCCGIVFQHCMLYRSEFCCCITNRARRADNNLVSLLFNSIFSERQHTLLLH